MVNQPIPQLLGNLFLQCFEFRIDKFDYATGFDVDQMIMMGFGNSFVASAPITEIVPIQYPCLFKQANRPIDGGNRNTGIDRRSPFVQGFNVGMILGIGNDTGYHPTLVGDAKAFFRT